MIRSPVENAMGLFDWLRQVVGSDGTPRLPHPSTVQLLEGGRPRTKPEAEPFVMKRISELATEFLERSLIAANRNKEELDAHEKLVVAAYLWGAVDALAQRGSCSDVQTISLFIALVSNMVEPAGEAAGVLAGTVHGTPGLMPIIQKGGTAVLAWLPGGGKEDPAELGALLMIWHARKP